MMIVVDREMWERKRGIRVLLALATGSAVISSIFGAWWLFGKKAGDSNCDQLKKDVRIEKALGKEPSGSMECRELGRSLKRVSLGNGGGGHTLAQARSMRLTLIAINDSMSTEQDAELFVNAALRQPLADMLTDYVADTQEIMGGVNSDYRRHDGPSGKPWKDANGVHMSVTQKVLARVMRAVSDSPKAYATLWKASVTRIAGQMDHVPAGEGVDGVRLMALDGACVMGMLQAVHFDAIRDDHDDDDPSIAAQEIADEASTPENMMSYRVGGWAKARELDEDSRDVDELQRDVRNAQNAALQDTEDLIGVRRG